MKEKDFSLVVSFHSTKHP